MVVDRPGRLVGLDVARCLALVGMIATHTLAPYDPDGTLATGQQLAGGRASALFAVLAGVSMALVSGRERPVRGRARLRVSVGLVVRAVLIAAVGLLLGELDSGLAVILTYYGLLFLLGLPFLGLRPPALAGVAAAVLVVAPVVSHLLRPRLPDRGSGSPTLGQLIADPAQLLAELAFTGYYPVVPWMAYLLAGLALGRLPLRRRRVQGALALGGLALAVAATVTSRWLVSLPSVHAPLLADAGAPDVPGLLRTTGLGMFGTTPTGGAWQWLLLAAPHSATPLDLAQTVGSALAAVGCCLLLVGLLPSVGQRLAAVLFGAGTTTLSLYSLHVALHTPDLWPDDDDFTTHVVVVLVLGALLALLGRRGPLEWLVATSSRLAAGAVPTPGRVPASPPS